MKRMTKAVDHSLGIIQLLLLAVGGVRGQPFERYVGVPFHILLHLWLHLQLRGGRRQACNRPRVMLAMMALHCAHAAVYNAGMAVPPDYVAMLTRSMWLSPITGGVFNFAGNQVNST